MGEKRYKNYKFVVHPPPSFFFPSTFSTNIFFYIFIVFKRSFERSFMVIFYGTKR